MQLQVNAKNIVVSEHPFGSFLALIVVDQEIRNFHEQISKLKTESESLLTQKNELTDRLKQFGHHVHELRKKVDEQELEIKTLDSNERLKKEQLNSVTNPKQIMPLKKEIDRLKQSQIEAESALMAAWNKLEAAQKDLAEQQKNYSLKIDDLIALLSTKHDAINTLTHQLEQKKITRPALEIGIPEEWLEKYSLMRLQVCDPVVAVMRNGCSACFYSITDQEIMRLKRKAIVQCKGCFRLLYMQEAMEPITEEK
jgi:predicted  nucleic acid-binding Zn-ribbon protein